MPATEQSEAGSAPAYVHCSAAAAAAKVNASSSSRNALTARTVGDLGDRFESLALYSILEPEWRAQRSVSSPQSA